MPLGSIPVFNTFGSLTNLFGLQINLKGLSGLLALLEDLGNRLIAEMMFEATKLFQEAYDYSQSIVHVITGHLKGSGVVATVSATEIVFAYAAVYAEAEETRGPTQKYDDHMFFKPSAVYITDSLDQRMGIAIERHLAASAQ